jgi:neutral ceramidase
MNHIESVTSVVSFFKWHTSLSRIAQLLLRPFLSFFLLFCIQDSNAQLRAAVVKADITPTESQYLLGYGERKSTGVMDRIYHRIVAIDDGTTQFFNVSIQNETDSPGSISMRRWI